MRRASYRGESPGLGVGTQDIYAGQWPNVKCQSLSGMRRASMQWQMESSEAGIRCQKLFTVRRASMLRDK